MPEWTKEQKSAIEDRGGTLLVSAAAGSGKTAVLTERVLRRVTDPENPIDITELLLVTFTTAAAAEMRERIAAAIGAAAPSAFPRAPREDHDRARAVHVARARAGGCARHRAGFPSDGRKREQNSAR